MSDTACRFGAAQCLELHVMADRRCKMNRRSFLKSGALSAATPGLTDIFASVFDGIQDGCATGREYSQRYVAVDLETTGFDPSFGSRVVEVAAIEILQGRFTGQRFHTYLNPECDLSPWVTKITGISRGMLNESPRFFEIAVPFLKFISGAILVFHNAPFHLRFLEREFANAGWSFERRTKVIDTLQIEGR